MTYTQTVTDQPVRSVSSRHSGWLHVCNGLDPVRDGGMVPSILGMTAALSRLRREVTIVTPTPSRLEAAQVLEEAGLPGPGRGQEPAAGVLPARPVTSRDRTLAGNRALDADLFRTQ